MHPPKCCLKCYAVLLNVKKEGSIPTYTSASWEPHSSNCFTYRIIRPEKSKGGRPSKRSKATGRPKAVVSVSDMMNIDASRPISSSVERAVAHVLEIKSQQSTSKTIEIKTSGSQSMTLTPIPIVRKESHDVTPRTVRARTKLAKELVQLLSGPSSGKVR